MLLPRQEPAGDPAFTSDDDYVYDSFWFSQTGIIIKYVIFGTSLFIFLVWFIGGYIHAQRRMKKGLAPLAYHKWLVPRYQRARFEPQLQGVVYYQYHGQQPQYYAAGQNGYPMQGYQEPPPLYNQDMPPTYQPPPGASKADPQQHYGPPSPQYAPPPGPPPSGSQAPQGTQQTGVLGNEPTAPAQAHYTGSSNPYRL
ncbi:hypothetical protein SLS55_008345 [Diplodia seriata]|nr:putative ubiquitin-protein ligase sel1 [Diplodia seriata]